MESCGEHHVPGHFVGMFQYESGHVVDGVEDDALHHASGAATIEGENGGSLARDSAWRYDA